MLILPSSYNCINHDFWNLILSLNSENSEAVLLQLLQLHMSVKNTSDRNIIGETWAKTI